MVENKKKHFKKVQGSLKKDMYTLKHVNYAIQNLTSLTSPALALPGAYLTPLSRTCIKCTRCQMQIRLYQCPHIQPFCQQQRNQNKIDQQQEFNLMKCWIFFFARNGTLCKNGGGANFYEFYFSKRIFNKNVEQEVVLFVIDYTFLKPYKKQRGSVSPWTHKGKTRTP